MYGSFFFKIPTPEMFESVHNAFKKKKDKRAMKECGRLEERHPCLNTMLAKASD